MKTKILAMYLPQFYETEYNSRWWGEGYTDWIASKNAKPLFNNHRQPRIPEHNNYYDLSDSSADTIRWQANLAREHGIYGFCIYHYWFPSKQLLDVPARILLDNKDIDINYSFCWDSKSWKRTWFLGSNESEILIEQDFGDESIWKRHYDDLRDYFKDDRYIKIDNKPVFHVYDTSSIECLAEMKAYWNRLAIEDGFSGIYLVTGDIRYRSTRETDEAVDAFYNYEPNYSFINQEKTFYHLIHLIIGAVKKRINKLASMSLFPDKRSAKRIYKCIEKNRYDINKKTYLGIFTDYDDTPRRQRKGVVYVNNTPVFFKRCLIKQLEKSDKLCNEFIYVTAWNEWGESAYLEPDEDNGSIFLQIIKECITECITN